MSKFQEFLNEWNGQIQVGTTTENTGECVGLVAKWVDKLGLPAVWGNASDWFANADEKFYTKILNTPDAIPQQGDCIVWNKSFNGTFGHTAIATGTADLHKFEVFEQNNPIGSNCHLRTYDNNYFAVIGWLRPKTQIQDCDPNWRIERDTNWTLYQGQIEENKKFVARIQELEGQVNEYKQKYEAEEKNNLELLTRNSDLAEQIQLISNQDKDYGQQILDAQHEKDELLGYFTSHADSLGCPTSPLNLKDIQLCILNKLDTLKNENTEEIKQFQKLYDIVFTNYVYKRVPKSKMFILKIFNKIKEVMI